MSMYGDDWQYANSRLEQTIVQYEGKPIFVGIITAGMKAQCRRLNSDQWVNIDGKLLDCKPVPLGYCNRKGDVAYVMRMPMRRDWRQGLRQGNFTTRGAFGPDYVKEAELLQVITGDYPTLAKCIESVGVKVSGMAWCREWALESLGGIKLMHKGREVGNLIDGKPTLDEQHNYLREALEEVL